MWPISRTHLFHPSIISRACFSADFPLMYSTLLFGISICYLSYTLYMYNVHVHCVYSTWPARVYLLVLITSMILLNLIMFLTHSVVLWSWQDTLIIVLSIFIWAPTKRCFKTLVTVHDSDVYVIAGKIHVQWLYSLRCRVAGENCVFVEPLPSCLD